MIYDRYIYKYLILPYQLQEEGFDFLFYPLRRYVFVIAYYLI